MGKGGGGDSYDPGPQYEYDKELLTFNYSLAKDQKKRQDDAYAMQLWNQNQNIDFQNQERIDAWQHKADMATYDYNNQIAARIASEEAVGKQLYYNELAEEIAINDSTRKYNERLTAIGFQNEDLQMKLYQTKDQLGLKKEGVGLKLADVIGKGELQKEGLTIQHKGKQAELSNKAQELGINSLKAAGQVAAMGQTGRSARKNMQSALAGFGQQQAIILDVLENSNSQYEQSFANINQNYSATEGETNLAYKQIATDLTQTEQTTEKGQRELKESMKSAQDQHGADKSQIALQKFQGDMQAEASLAPEPSMPPQPKAPVDLPRPKSMSPAEIPSWDRIPKPRSGTAGSSAGGLSQFLGAAGSVAGIIGTVATLASFASDDRLKYKINRVGNSKKGIPIYTFKYRFDGEHGPTYRGTSAQDLLEIGRGDAVNQTEKDGFYYVDYSKLDVNMELVKT
tara:strand:+ start:580 stop:1944 length:1365 start_codon:yes stop_codon:yes gene_type:complete